MNLIKTSIEVNNAVFSLPYHVAQEREIFKAEGLDVTLVPAGSGRDRDKEVPDKPIEDHTQVKSPGSHCFDGAICMKCQRDSWVCVRPE